MSPTKQQLNALISGLTIRQLDELKEAFGMNQAEVLTIAIDRLYQAEVSGKVGHKACDNCGRKMAPNQEYPSNLYGGPICKTCYEEENNYQAK